MKITPDCQCGRGLSCGLISGKLDDLDYQKMWLPAGYLNRIQDSSFSQNRKDKSEVDYPNRREAVKAFLAYVKKNNSRF